MDEPVPLSVLALDLPAPPCGWAFELERRGITIVLDPIGRRSVSRTDAAVLLGEHRENEARVAQHREELERRAVAADEARRAAIPRGIPVVAGMTAAESLLLADPPDREPRRESVLEWALARRDADQ